jgi:hypothetical protein
LCCALLEDLATGSSAQSLTLENLETERLRFRLDGAGSQGALAAMVCVWNGGDLQISSQ